MFLVEESNKGVHYEDQERDSSRTLIRTYFWKNMFSIKMCKGPKVHFISKSKYGLRFSAFFNI
jgi:hypothetical protein